MSVLRPLLASDAEVLFPLIYQSEVTDTLVWDGPDSLEVFREEIAKRAALTAAGERHIFTILDDHKSPIGSAGLRPDDNNFRADIGLWIGLPHQRKGYGTKVIGELLNYGFENHKLEKIEAAVYIGNWPSRRIFEVNGFLHEGTIRKAELKRGRALDEWVFGITREEYGMLLHICPRQKWEIGQNDGSYHPTSLAEVGFIHCSRIDQVVRVANSFYRETDDLRLIWIDPQKLVAKLRWETAEEEDFPHIYGPLNLSAVVGVSEFALDETGRFRRVPRPGIPQ